MRTKRWRPTLSTRITLTLVAVAVGVAAITAGTLVWNARLIILESRQAAIFDVLRVEAKMSVDALPETPSEADLTAASEEFSVPAVLINLRTGENGGTLLIDDIPEYLVQTLVDGGGVSAYERETRYGFLTFTAGTVVDAGDGGDQIAAFGVFDMQTQQEEIDRLVNLGVSVGLIFVAAAAVIGLVVGRQLGRPLESLVEVADGLGTPDQSPVVDTGYPDVNAVLDAMRNSEARLHTTIGQLEHSEATARQLVADVAHELRTPLATLVAVSEILADTESATPENRSEAGQIAARSATHLTTLTNDILELSRFDSNKADVVREPVEITELWRDLAENRQWEDVAFDLYGDPIVNTDEVRLRLIVSNLVTNALRHGAPPVEVTVWNQDGTLTLTVADGGPGVADEHEAQVFKRFYQASSSRSGSESSGLGLAIVRENARLLGGDAWLTQTAGTVFAVWIPTGMPQAAGSNGGGSGGETA
ncbi:sensor histidine kinase [Leucobacter aridicollis]|uniref:histidine kinase n=1 Tax=Leucobacter aridicollis TaxID=283878 RepID=A0A852R624_9MICO|nr:HAMP domain-containing sensor histidine kinase [Leucobacter aridicollis]MBL3682491.1 sensor histidine kinase [Leucobacter aridicollis]NYD25909.1 two-component system sensor histidine kinase MtrB [Leucobacter aridicollis]